MIPLTQDLVQRLTIARISTELTQAYETIAMYQRVVDERDKEIAALKDTIAQDTEEEMD
jgi:hypothetical protein